MPRGSAPGKRQQGASSSNARHDNGLVAPGKKLSRGRNGNASSSGSGSGSNSGPDGKTSTNGKPVDFSAATASPPRPRLTQASSAAGNGSATTTSAANGHRHGPSNGAANGFAKTRDDNMAVDRRSQTARRSSLADDSETSTSTDSLHSQRHRRHGDHQLAMNERASPAGAIEPRQIDVNTSKYSSDVHRDSGPFDYAATVLMALPLHDTLAILLILMHVSPLTLSVIYTVFTVLTFATPITANSVVNIHLAELLDWQSTMPSFLTVACVDVLAILVFLFLWPSVQGAILDLAKPVIAATLGGGSASRARGQSRVSGQSRTVSACFAFVIGTHVFKNSRGHWTRFLRVLPPSWRLSPDSDDPMEDMSRGAAGVVRHPSPWYFTLLGVHILMQGIVRYIREWYIRREKSSAAAASTAGDPEAGRPASAISDPSGDIAPRADSEPSTTTPHGGSALSSNKRRRRQGAQVRLQQPLWAALASTKVVMIKEYELSHATSESAIADATDIHNLGNALFDREVGKIWISYVGCDEVSFDTSYFSNEIDDCEEDGSGGSPSGAYSNGDPFSAVDRTKPFYVKINNAHWPSTRIVPARDAPKDDDDSDGEGSSALEGQSPYGTKWTGDIYGLRPMSKYVCEFVDTHTDTVLFTATITTTRERTRSATAAAASSAASPNGLPNGQRRQHSPASTLRTSIAASDAKLSAEKAKLKTLRKEWKAKVNALRRENDSTDHSIGSAGGTDDRYRQKIRQQETQRSQAEREVAELAAAIKAFDDSPGDDVSPHKEEAQRGWHAEKALLETSQRDFKRHSSAAAGSVKAAEAEAQTLRTRRNKIAGRVAKVDAELAGIADANERGLNEAERRRQEREAWQRRVSGVEEKMNGDFNALQMDNSILQDQHASAVQQATALHGQISFPGGGGPGKSNGLPSSPSQYTPSGSSWNLAVSGAPPISMPAHTSPHYASHWPVSAEHSSGVPSVAPVPTTSSGSGAPLWTFPPIGTPAGGVSAPAPHSHAAYSHMPSLPRTGSGGAPPGFRARGRSSSMLSDVSGFTHLSGEEEGVGPAASASGGGATISVYRQGGLRGTPGRAAGRRKGSIGASSGSGSGSASHPASPL